MFNTYSAKDTQQLLLSRDPSERVTLTGSLSAGVLLRKETRAIFDLLRLRGVTVELNEQKGWFDSVFTYKLDGKVKDVLPLFDWQITKVD